MTVVRTSEVCAHILLKYDTNEPMSTTFCEVAYPPLTTMEAARQVCALRDESSCTRRK